MGSFGFGTIIDYTIHISDTTIFGKQSRNVLYFKTTKPAFSTLLMCTKKVDTTNIDIVSYYGDANSSIKS